MDPEPGDFVMERHGQLRELDRSFDIAYWQRLGPAAIFAAAREMAEFAYRKDPLALRMDRSVEVVRKARR